jgi:hypothetical protein
MGGNMEGTNAIASRIGRFSTAIMLVFVLANFVHRPDNRVSLFAAVYNQMQLLSSQSDR